MAEWVKYEEVVRLLLNQYRDAFGLDRVEPKQKVPGDSGTEWEIDVVAYAKEDDKLILFECRQYKNKIKQEAVGGFAFRIDDTQAAKGYIVTPLGLQKGAEIVAQYKQIGCIRIPRDATAENHIVQFLDMVFIGVTDRAGFKERVMIEKRDDQGNLIERVTFEG
jgi:predicted helicase